MLRQRWNALERLTVPPTFGRCASGERNDPLREESPLGGSKRYEAADLFVHVPLSQMVPAGKSVRQWLPLHVFAGRLSSRASNVTFWNALLSVTMLPLDAASA
jgi:hypothetical protein